MEIFIPDALSGIDGAQAPEICARRRDRLRKKLMERGLDLLLVGSPPNRFYLSAFELHDPQPNESAGILLVAANGEDWLITDSRYALAAEKIWPKDRLHIYSGSLAKAVSRLVVRSGNLAGLESKAVSWDFVNALKTALGGKAFLQPADGLVEDLRVIKDAGEIMALRQSFKLNHQMYEWLDKEIVQNDAVEMTEEKLAWEIERFFRDRGAQELAFSTIVASGTKSAEPHAEPGNAALANGAPLLVDSGCRVNNYCSDQTRTWWLGANPSREFISAMALVREAQQAAMEIMRPGIPCAEVYAEAKKVFARAGCDGAFTHGLGHGVGLETHEAPRLSASSGEYLEEGMTITVEPGLYYPEWGGIRWENTVLVTRDGIEIL